MTRTMLALLFVGAVQLIARGTDLLFSPAPQNLSAYDLEVAEGIAWGVSCLVAAALVLAGATLRKPVVAIQGALTAFAIYAMFAWSVLDHTLLLEPPDDWRILFDHAAHSAFWIVVATSISFRHGVHKILNRKGEADGVGTAF